MLAKLERSLPDGDYFYEPKWDGFRGIVFRHGTDVEIGSRNELPLTRYFPELVADLRTALPDAAVVDGEVVVAGPGGLDFDALSQRVHPASSRVRMLAEKTPASFVAFDLLALGERDLRGQPFHERRSVLEDILGPPGPVSRSARVHLTPATRQRSVAEDWFGRFEGAGLDGVVAKPAGLVYVPGKRVMVKVKHQRTAEFVVGGFRWYRASSGAASGQEVGSLMLGLYDAAGRLSHVGVIGAFPAEQRRQLAEVLAPYRALAAGAGAPAGDEHPWAAWAAPAQLNGPAPAGPRPPGARSRWNAAKDLSFEPVRPELVVEAAYEHLQGDRLRHTAQFRRWRPDRDPRSCTYDQLEAVVPMLLAEVFGAGVIRGGGSDASARPHPGARSRYGLAT
jgi:ATP-dependent DNA ligase